MKGLLTTADLPGGAEGLRRRWRRVGERIAAAAARVDRPAEDVLLVAVTKYVETDVIGLLHALGQHDIGESRVQDLARKSESLEALTGLRYHLIGHLQRNKARRALSLARTIHSLDSLSLLRAIDEHLARLPPPHPDYFVEVNVSGEEAKTGLPPAELEGFLREARRTEHLGSAIRGLMTLAPYSPDPEAARPCFRRLRELRDRCRDGGLLPADAGLSMGMSGDFEVAVEEGATCVRVGSILFEEDEAR